ncbi:MAG: ABC transporter permease [Betaproteobacteria bacterium]
MDKSPRDPSTHAPAGAPVDAAAWGVVEQPLSRWERLTGIAALRKLALLLVLALIWEAYARWLNNPLVLPTCGATLQAFADKLVSGELLLKAGVSLKVLLQGYAIGLALALALSVLAMTTRLGQDLLELLTAMLNPLPAIALLPLALVWLGLGNPSIVFVLVHSVMWPVALNTHAGFQAVSPTLRMVGRNVGLTGPAYVLRILVPAAFPSILAGLKVGWAFAWRTLIAAELVFGTTSGSGGLGWFIYENKNVLDIPAVFAGLFAVIVIGLLVEGLIFRNLERATVRKWGMQA